MFAAFIAPFRLCLVTTESLTALLKLIYNNLARRKHLSGHLIRSATILSVTLTRWQCGTLLSHVLGRHFSVRHCVIVRTVLFKTQKIFTQIDIFTKWLNHASLVLRWTKVIKLKIRVTEMRTSYLYTNKNAYNFIKIIKIK